MKRTLSFVAVILLTGTLFAQQLQVSPKTHLQKQKINTTRATVTTLAYCTDTAATAIGMNSDAEFGVYVSFPASMMGTYTGDLINQVQLGLTQIANIASVEVRIYEDTNGVAAGTATPLTSETVNVANLVDGWNNIFLSSPYTITGNQIFVGYWIHQTAGYTCDVSDNALVDPDGGWVVDPSGWGTLHGYGLDYNWQIKAVVDDGTAADDVSATAIVVPQAQCGLTASEQVTVTVQNLGSNDLTNPFNLEYTVNGAGATTVAVPVPLAVGATVDVNFNVDMSASGVYQIDAYTTLGSDVDHSNDTIQGVTMHTDPAVVPYSVQFDPGTGDFVGWFAEDVNNDANTWGVYDVSSIGGGHGDNYAVLYQYSSSNAADDYMYSNCIDLQASKTYKLDFWYKAMSASYPEKMKVMIGSDPASGSMTTQIVDLGTITDTVWTESISNFTVPADGTYNLGFYAYSDANEYFLFFDDVVVDEVTNINTVNPQTISVYPTLTTGIVNISVSSDVEVYSQLGQKVMTANNTQSVDLSSLNSGIYFVKISNDNGSVMRKVVLTK